MDAKKGFRGGFIGWSRRKLVLFGALFFSVAAVCGAEEEKKFQIRPGVEIICESNKSALSYQPGEEMVFKFRLNTTENIPETWYLRYDRAGDDRRYFRGKVPAHGEVVIKTSLKKPGFLNFEVYLADEKARPVLRDEKRSHRIAFYAGAAVAPETLKDCGEPADFDEFWAKQKQRLAAVPFAKAECKLARKGRGGNVYAVSIPCAGPRPATGYLLVPEGAEKKSLPARIEFYGYGARPQVCPSIVPKDALVLKLNAHGQMLGQDKEYYDKFFASLRSGKYTYAFDPEQNKDPENCFFNGMALRALRAVEYLKSRPEWNGKDLIATGTSQGGMQALWVTALDPAVTSAVVEVPWCCDLAGKTKAKRLAGLWRLKYVPGLDYFDPVFMAKRIKNAEVKINRAGLGDYACPPSGIAVLYNNLATPKKSIRWVQGGDHVFVPTKSEVIVWPAGKSAAE